MPEQRPASLLPRRAGLAGPAALARTGSSPRPGSRGAGRLAPTRTRTAPDPAGQVLTLEAVEFGIVELEQAFLPYLLTGSGQTVYEEAKPRLDALQAGDVPKLLDRGKEKHGGS